MAITVEAPGCHRIHAGLGPVWWITANDLPLEEALLPFLLARSGKHRVELAQWLSQKRDFSTVREMIKVFRMNKVNLQDYLRYEKEDEEAGDRALREFLEAGLEAFPDILQKREEEIRRELQEAQRAAQAEAPPCSARRGPKSSTGRSPPRGAGRASLRGCAPDPAGALWR
jgi:hypothetical protein